MVDPKKWWIPQLAAWLISMGKSPATTTLGFFYYADWMCIPLSKRFLSHTEAINLTRDTPDITYSQVLKVWNGWTWGQPGKGSRMVDRGILDPSTSFILDLSTFFAYHCTYGYHMFVCS